MRDKTKDLIHAHAQMLGWADAAATYLGIDAVYPLFTTDREMDDDMRAYMGAWNDLDSRRACVLAELLMARENIAPGSPVEEVLQAIYELGWHRARGRPIGTTPKMSSCPACGNGTAACDFCGPLPESDYPQ